MSWLRSGGLGWAANGRFVRGSLGRRLLVSYVLVLAADVLVFAASLMVNSPLTRSGPATLSNVPAFQQYTQALDRSLLRALVICAVTSLVVGAGASVVIIRRLLEPLSRLGSAARRLSEGQYGEPITPPYPSELRDLVADVNELAARLADVETRRARLVSDLAHELRTPLTIIEGQLVGVSDGVYALSEELMASVKEEVGRLRRLTEDLSGLSRAEENAYTLDRERIDLAALVGELAGRLRPQFAGRQIVLTVTSPGPTWARLDPDRVTQILTNLLLNALAVTDAGGQVNIAVQDRGGDVAVVVADDGAGIAESDLDRIFLRFERVRSSDGQAGGSGIGLTIARALARAHGGELSAASAGPGRGATFTAQFPKHQPADAADADVPAEGPAEGAVRR